MKTSRRSFLKMLLAGGAIGATGLIASNLGLKLLGSQSSAKPNSTTQQTDQKEMKYPYPNDPNTAWGMVIDLQKCTGCQDYPEGQAPCQTACREMHNVPPEMDYIKIYQKQDNVMQKPYNFPRICMQCENPPCVNICPVGAAFRREDGDGLVLIDHGRCIGCRLCMAACPYETRYFNWYKYDEPNKKIIPEDSPYYVTFHPRGVTDKCDFCGGHLGYRGQISGCASACPEGALYYGNLKENAVTNSKGETINVTEIVKARGGYRYKEELGTHPRVYYLP
ncbi:MAG: 4Fe-4S dicluster domain-containing protein [Candidatus Thorarchaeota archaeon]